MEFRGDERAVVIQIGAVLLLAAIVIAMSGYQATVVPDQNNEIEFNHNQDVQGQMQELRNGIVSAPGGGSGASVRVDLGVRYPSRTFFVNPSPATGTLRTVGTTDGNVNITVDNAVASGETGEYWNGTNRSFNTGALVYEPKYSEYDEAPTTIYEQSILYNRFDDANITISEQSMVDGRQINLVALNGSLSESGTDSTSVSVRPVSASRNAVALEGDGGDPINITVPTRLDNVTWRNALEEEYASNGGNIVRQYYEDVPSEAYALLTIELDGSKTYNLRMAKVGVGSDVAEEPEDLYLTDVEGGGSVDTDGTQRITVEVRDRYNNPVSGERVNLTVDGDGELDNGSTTAQFATGTSDSDGRVTVTYEAPGSETIDTVTADINATPAASEKVEFTMDVVAGGGSGSGGSAAYSVDWRDPDNDNPSDPLSGPCTTESCTWDLGADADGALDLRAALSDSIGGMTIEFGVNDTSAGTVSPSNEETDAGGEAVTTLTGIDNGSISVYAASGGSSDRITVEIVNASGGGGGGNAVPTASFSYSPTEPMSGETVTFDGSGSGDPEGDELTYEWDFDGDGTYEATTSGPTVEHSYPDDGNYSVTLRVTDSAGNTDTATKTISVQNRPPSASFTWDCGNDNSCTFDGNGSSDPDDSTLTYSWDFDDGTTGTGQNTSQTYSTPGTYTVTLTVEDDDGATDSESKTVTTGGGVAYGETKTWNSNNSVVNQSISNNRNDDVTIVAVKVNETGGNVKQLDGSRLKSPEVELRNFSTRTGYADSTRGYTLPANMSLAADGSTTSFLSSESQSLYLTEFLNNGGNSVDMNGKSLTITITYQANGKTFKTTQTVTV